MAHKVVKKIQDHYSRYLWKISLEDYLAESRKSKIGDEEKITDSLFESLIKDKDIWNYSEDTVLLQQQQHKVIINGKRVTLKPDFETNNEFCKIPILFDAKASNIPHHEMTSGIDTVYEYTFKRYLTQIKPISKYIIGFNLEYIILYSRKWEKDIQVQASIDVKKLFQDDIEEIKRLEQLLDYTRFVLLNNEEKIEKLISKKLEKESIFNIDLFIKKFKNTQDWLYGFFFERLKQIGIKEIPDEIRDELSEFQKNENDFIIQLANRLTLIEFFKYIFIRTYEDFQLIHKINDDTIIPVTFGESVKKIDYENLDEFREKYIRNIDKTSFKDIGEQFFQGFSTLFNKYENFTKDFILTGDSSAEEFDKEYYNHLFDILFFLNEFYFGGLEAEWDDIIGRLYETSLERADRKKFGQFYTPRYIIDFILDELGITPAEDKKILDLSCGTGGFLMKYLAKINGKILLDSDESHLKNIFQWTYGIDIKMFSTLLTKLNLALIFIIKNKYLIERNLWTHRLDTKNIITWDGLEINKEESKKLEKWSFDYVVGNPPYVGIKGNADIVSRVKEDWTLAQYFTSKPDLYYFFIIHGIEKLKVWGKLWYIFPREWMTADFANKLRGYILDHTKILKLIDLNGISIFEDAGTTSCLLFLEKVSEKIENQRFDFIQFHNHEGQNIIKFIDEHSEELQTKTTETKKQKVLSGYEAFSQKIMRPEDFDKIIAKIKKNERCDISFLGGFTTGVVYLDKFIDVKIIEQKNLSEYPWLFGNELPVNPNIYPIDVLLKISQWILTGADTITKSHVEKWLAADYEIWRGIFVIEENREIRWSWLDDLRLWHGKIRKIEINLYENGGWTELNDTEKVLIKPLYYGRDFEKWNKFKTNIWLIYSINKEIPEWSLRKYLMKFQKIINNSSSNAPFWMHRGRTIIPFEHEKIVTISRWKFDIDTYQEKLFTYLDGVEYSGTNYIFIDEKNPYTKILEKNSTRKEYLKFINAILNSKVIIDYIKDNKFNDLSGAKLSELKIPKVNFDDSEQVERYGKIVKLADILIGIYKEKEGVITALPIFKRGNELLEIGSEEYDRFIASRDFEIVEDILYALKVDGIEYYGLDGLKPEIEGWKKSWKSLWEILGVDTSEIQKKIEKINTEIDTLAYWFYHENTSVPSDFIEDKQASLL